jgi:hypothetical protein
MIDKPNSPLRQRMIEDITARRFKEKVQKVGPIYLSGITPQDRRKSPELQRIARFG